MGRKIVIAGVILIIIGSVLPVVGVFRAVDTVGPMMFGLTETDTLTAEFCRTGEQMEIRDMPASSTVSGFYTCVNVETGQTRDVTEAVLEDVFSEDMSGFLNGVFSNLSTFFLAGALFIFGILLVLMGAIKNSRERRYAYVTVPNGPVKNKAARFAHDLDDNPFYEEPEEDTVIKRLQKLDEHYAQGFISREEYERQRQSILDAL